MTWVLYLIIACGALSIAYGVWTTRAVLAADPGTARMQEIAAAIQEGAQAYLARQYTTIAIVGVVIFAILAYLLGIPQAIGFAIGVNSYAPEIGPEGALERRAHRLLQRPAAAQRALYRGCHTRGCASAFVRPLLVGEDAHLTEVVAGVS